MLTLGQIKNSSIANIASVDVQSGQFLQYVNDAVRILSDMGDWWATVRVMHGCVYDSTIVWPSEVATVLAVNDCKSHVPVANHWYQFSDERWPHPCSEKGGARSAVEFSGTSCLFRNHGGYTGILMFKVSSPADIGKSVAVYGEDENGNQVVHRLSLEPDGVSTGAMRSVSRIQKDVTSSNLSAYWCSELTGIESIAGVYRPNDEIPQFLVSHWSSPPEEPSAKVSALVKLAFTPMVLDSDLSLVDSLDAIKEMVMALRKREAGDSEGAIKNEIDAVRRLNSQLRNRVPDRQISIAVNAFGSAQPRKHGIGGIY